MSAIDELKAELTRLGVEYDFTDRLREVPSYQSVTWWFNTADKARFLEYHDGSTQLIVRSIKSGVTPEEAIAATLGTGTCRNVHEPPKDTTFWPAPHFKCSECGEVHVSMQYVYFCPNCGKKVISE